MWLLRGKSHSCGACGTSLACLGVSSSLYSLYLQAPPVFRAYKARVLYVVYVPFRPCSTAAAHAHCVYSYYSPVHRSACRPPAARGAGAGCGGVAMLAAGTGQTPGRGGAATARDRERRGHSERAPVAGERRDGAGVAWTDRQAYGTLALGSTCSYQLLTGPPPLQPEEGDDCGKPKPQGGRPAKNPAGAGRGPYPLAGASSARRGSGARSPAPPRHAARRGRGAHRF